MNNEDVTPNSLTPNSSGASPVKWAMEDVDLDDDTDMILHFETQDLDLDNSSHEAPLTATTFGAIDIEGSDWVMIVKSE